MNQNNDLPLSVSDHVLWGRTTRFFPEHGLGKKEGSSNEVPRKPKRSEADDFGNLFMVLYDDCLNTNAIIVVELTYLLHTGRWRARGGACPHHLLFLLSEGTVH